MDRVRAGLTGLGLVFLVTVGASVLVAREPSVQPPKEKSSEPLAQLGVAPGPDKEPARAAGMAAPASEAPPQLEAPPPAVPEAALAAHERAAAPAS